VICAVTGILLVPAYKPDTALDSLALLLLKNPAGIFVRSLHYWSAQAFLVLTLAHVLEHMLRRSEIKVTFGVWWRLSLTVPIVLAVMLSGFLLRGDGAATQALQVLRSLLGFVPWIGASLVRMLTGSGADLQTIYLHHACTATIVIWLVTIEHARRILPRAQAIAWTLPPSLALSALLVPWLESRTQPIEKGPWYFGSSAFAGLQTCSIPISFTTTCAP
jgi:ubiquinol-cytochrome c reductase cytochrome b subunit